MFIDFTSPVDPIPTIINFGPLTGQTVTNLTTAPTTYVGVNGAGVLVQQITPFTNSQRRSIASIGILIHTNLSSVTLINKQGALILAPNNQLYDFMEAIGPLNIAGNKYSAGATNLTIQKTAGTIFKWGANSADINDPHKLTLGDSNPTTIRYRTMNGEVTGDLTSIVPGSYDNAGVVSAVGANEWTIQHINVFQSGATRIQYGQNLYGSLADAQANVFTEPFQLEQNIADNGLFRGYLLVKGNATNLSLDAQAVFIEVPKFGGGAGNSGAALTSANIIAALGYTPVDGPASSTDNAIARFDGTTGNVIQDSSVTILDSGDVVTSTTGGLKLHVGTTAQRPTPLLDGYFRKNNTLSPTGLEYYDTGTTSWRLLIDSNNLTNNVILNQTLAPQVANAWIGGGGETLKIGTNNTGGINDAYVGFYKSNINPTIRSGIIGYNSIAGNNLSITNEIAGSLIVISAPFSVVTAVGAGQSTTDINGFQVEVTGTVNQSVIALGKTAFVINTFGSFNRTLLSDYSNGAAITLRTTGGGISDAVLNNGILGRYTLGGHLQTALATMYDAASIRGIATQNWSTGNGGGKLDFYTTPNSTVAQVLALTIDQDGQVINRTTGAMVLNVGTTAQRPTNLNDGAFRKNNSLSGRGLEYYDLGSTAWRTLWDSGNSGTSSTDWMANNLYASGSINVPTGISIVLGDTGGTNGFFRVVTASGINYIQSGIGNTSGTRADLAFTGNFGAGESMRIKVNGNVGIGTDSPSEKLHVNGAVMSAFASKSGAPTASDIPAGFSKLYEDTAAGTIRLWANHGGTLKSVLLT